VAPGNGYFPPAMSQALVRARTLPRIPVLNVALFLATVATTLLAGAGQTALRDPQGLGSLVLAGLPFASALIGILLCHEMGHYLMARAYRVDSSLPFFIPMPMGQVGTFGAVIRIRSQIPSRTAVLDIGSAGPFAGFVVALPLLAWGIAHSEVRPIGDAWAATPVGMGAFGWVKARLLTGSWPEAAGGQFFGDSLVTWGMQRLILGKLPPGHDVFLHPVAFAAWFGLFVTTLNLFPIGQLDGGHVTYALLGHRRARALSRLVSWALLACGLFVSWTWLPWWAVTRFVVRFGHPPALLEEPLSAGRRALAVLTPVVFAATFIPVPFAV
jgi:membrane-associated protease RseP (regulator of RpoE activity)